MSTSTGRARTSAAYSAMTDKDLLALLDAVVNDDCLIVLEGTTFTAHVRINGPCVIRDCAFPEGLTVGRGGSIRFEGHNSMTVRGKTYTVNGGAILSTDHTEP